jgi:hypothetical protein
MNLFKSKLVLPKRVYIVAPGFEGRHYFDAIPPDSYVIAVSKGIIAFPAANIWLCSDSELPEKDWFEYGNDHSKAITIFSERLAERTHKVPDYIFDQDPVLCFHDYEARWGCLRCGCSVSAQAVQLAYHFGAMHVTLVGVDMYGRKYFDGTDGGYIDEREGEWNCIVRFNSLIKWLNEHGMIVDSLSPTALNIEVVTE